MKSRCCAQDTTVVDTRETQDGFVIRRRRECTRCKERFKTLEFDEDSLSDKSESIRLETPTLRRIRDLIDEELNRIERVHDDIEEIE